MWIVYIIPILYIYTMTIFHTIFGNIFLQYESLKILMYIVRITVYYDVILSVIL